MDTEHTAIPERVRRIEVFTGAGRRRTWSAENKARIVSESVTSGESVCAVARRHGLSPQQLFSWRRRVRQPAAPSTEATAPLFVPAVVAAPVQEHASRERAVKPPRQAELCGLIEVEIDGVTVRVGRGAEAKTVMVVLRALKAGA